MMENRSLAENTSLSSDEDKNCVVIFVESLEQIIIPIIVIVGLVGNVLSAIIFLQANLRQTSCCLYLASRALADLGFLLCLFIIWLQKVGANLLNLSGICQVVIFLSYLCAFLSVWYVVWVTIENYYRMCRPFKVSFFCTVTKARFVIILTTVVGCALYGISLVTNHVVEDKGMETCSWENKYELINRILMYGDTFVTLALPSGVILVVMGMIVCSMLQECRRQSGNIRQGSRALQNKMTHLLFVVSFVFLLLNLPSHIIRVKLVLDSMTGSTVIPELSNYILQRLFQQIYYLNFAINVFIYLVFCDSFRNKCLYMCCPGYKLQQTRRSALNEHDQVNNLIVAHAPVTPV